MHAAWIPSPLESPACETPTWGLESSSTSHESKVRCPVFTDLSRTSQKCCWMLALRDSPQMSTASPEGREHGLSLPSSLALTWSVVLLPVPSESSVSLCLHPQKAALAFLSLPGVSPFSGLLVFLEASLFSPTATGALKAA